MFGKLTLTKAPLAPVVEAPDAAVIRAWGFTPETWGTLSDAERIDYRDRVAYAPYLQLQA